MSAWQGQQYSQQQQQYNQQQQQHQHNQQQQQYNQQQQQLWQSGQQGRSSWQDPRFNQIPPNPYSTQSPVPQNSQSPVPAQNAAAAHDTAYWGVKFNHAQQPVSSIQQKPPLPPRPPSGLAHTPSPAASVIAPSRQPLSWQIPVSQGQVASVPSPIPSAGPHLPPFSPTQQHIGAQYPQGTQATISHSATSFLPPPPPPPPPPLPSAPARRSSAYQSQVQLDQALWTHQPASHQNAPQPYDPSHTPHSYNLQQPPQRSQHTYPGTIQSLLPTPGAPQTHNLQVEPQPPVSPEEAFALPWSNSSQSLSPRKQSNIEPGASALGDGGPSDWEHFDDSVVAMVDGETRRMTNGIKQSVKPALNEEYAELPANFSRSNSVCEAAQNSATNSTQPTFPSLAGRDVPPREHSVSPESSREGLRRTGTIDGVIQAWTTPLKGENRGEGSRRSSVSTLDHPRPDWPESVKSSQEQASQSQAVRDRKTTCENGSPFQVEPESRHSHRTVSNQQTSSVSIPMSSRTVEVDPYADLGPEYKASLARYVAMLRKEEAAPEEERHKIFRAFMLKENLLRSVLYNVDALDSETSLPSHAQATKTKIEMVAHEPLAASSAEASLSPNNEPDRLQDSAKHSPVKLKLETASASNEDSYVLVDPEDSSDFSPGGRPRMTRIAPKRTASHPAPRSVGKPTSSPSDYAPIVVDEEFLSASSQTIATAQIPPPRPSTAPLAQRRSVLTEPIKFEPHRPAYTPFRYAERPQGGSAEPLSVTRPAYQAYSELRHQSADSGRVMAQSVASVPASTRQETITSPTGNSARREHEEAFLGLIREKSRAYRVGRQGTPPSASVSDPVPRHGPVDHTKQTIGELRSIIPSTMPQQRPASAQLTEAKKAMERYPDVFTWIPETVVRWDRASKAIRVRQEKERQKRQEESEKHVDTLYNEHEIGYSDIGQLEADFTLAEATKKYEEDVQELESFTDQVFTPVADRLKGEVVQLNALYVRAVDMLELEADNGIQYIHGKGDRSLRSGAMEVVLALYQKLQVRHVKLAEAHYERERRRKRLELSVLYTNGDTAAMRKLEQEFSKAERQQALHEAREKDTRANKLMDTFDRATVRGLGDNQQLVDEVVAKLQGLNDLLKGKQEQATEHMDASTQDTLRSIEELLDFVANDSKTLLTISNTADDMLNTADYDISVAEARLSNATAGSMKVLEEEKEKEDERIRAEVDTRMGSVAKGPEYALSLVRNMMKRLGDGPQHQDRVQRALEAAKLRNASTTPMG